MEIRARYLLIGVFTLAVILGGFAAVYWMNHSGGLTQRSTYRVRFVTPVAGLLLGSDVLFNGVRVGEVTGLTLNRDRPAETMVMIAIVADTPLRVDTRVRLTYGGLTGTASIAMDGGSPDAALPTGGTGGPPTLEASADAGADWTEAARDAFSRIDMLLADNSEALHEMIVNIDTFAAALARNSDRVDRIVAGLERMTAGAAAGPATIYDLSAPKDFAPGLPMPAGQLVVVLPTATVSLDTQRFLVGSDLSESLAFDDAKWSDSIPNLVRARLVEAFENAGYVRTGGDMQGLAADRQLLTDIRTFRISTDGPAADVKMTAKIVGNDGQVVAARSFAATAPVGKMEAAAAAEAINQAFQDVATDLVVWTLSAPAAGAP